MLTIFKCTIQWCKVHTQNCVSITTIFRTLSSSQIETLCPLSNDSLLPQPPGDGNNFCPQEFALFQILHISGIINSFSSNSGLFPLACFQGPSCCVCVCAQSFPALCDPKDCSSLGSSVPGISQGRIPEGLPLPIPANLPNTRIKPTSLIVACTKHHSLWLLSNIPLYVCITFCLFNHLLTHTWVISVFWHL